MRKQFVVLVGLASLAVTGLATADGPTLTRAVPPLGATAPDTADLLPIRKRLALRRAAQEKYLAAAKADPRFEQAKGELVAAANIADPKQRRIALKAVGTKWQAFRAEMLKKANIDLNGLKAQIAAIPLVKSVPVVTGAGLVAAGPAAPATLTASSFPEQYTHKKNCADGGDSWQFNGQKTRVNASSTPTNNDCEKVSAGKGARFELPAGVKKVEVTAEWVYELDAFAITHGIYGNAYGATGLRIESLAGVTLTTIDMAGGPPLTYPVRSDQYASVAAECDILPGCEDSNNGTARMTVSFNIDKPGGMIVAPYVNAGADADLHSTAAAESVIHDIKSISVKVYK